MLINSEQIIIIRGSIKHNIFWISFVVRIIAVYITGDEKRLTAAIHSLEENPVAFLNGIQFTATFIGDL